MAEHFNRISQFAPTVSRRPLMATPLVRKSVEQGHLDTFDAGGLADSENKLRQQAPPRPSHTPKSEKKAFSPTPDSPCKKCGRMVPARGICPCAFSKGEAHASASVLS